MGCACLIRNSHLALDVNVCWDFTAIYVSIVSTATRTYWSIPLKAPFNSVSLASERSFFVSFRSFFFPFFCKETPECASSPCQHHGACLATPQGFECQCKPGYTGTFCERKFLKQQSRALLNIHHERWHPVNNPEWTSVFMLTETEADVAGSTEVGSNFGLQIFLAFFIFFAVAILLVVIATTVIKVKKIR